DDPVAERHCRQHRCAHSQHTKSNDPDSKADMNAHDCLPQQHEQRPTITASAQITSRKSYPADRIICAMLIKRGPSAQGFSWHPPPSPDHDDGRQAPHQACATLLYLTLPCATAPSG